MTDYGELVRFIAGSIVGDSEHLEVRVRPGGRQTVVHIKAAQEDMGKLIGTGGRNIEALRAVIRAAGLRHRQRVQVDLD